MKSIEVTVTGITRIYCPRCNKLQVSIQPKSGYKVQNPTSLPVCERCVGTKVTNQVVSTLKSKIGKSTKQIRKQNNRKKYRIRYEKNRTLKS